MIKPRDIRKIIINILSVILGVCCSLTGYGQKSITDQIDQLNNTGKKYILKPDSLIIYADKAYELAKKYNYDDGEATALKLKGIYEYRKSNFNQSIAYYQQSLAIYAKKKNDLELGKAYLNIAISYQGKSDYVNTAANGIKALPYFEKVNDNNGKGRVLNLLGLIAFEQHQFKKANEYFFAYNALAKSVKDTVEIGSSYNNIARTYQELKKIDSAIYYNNRSLSINNLEKNEFGKAKNYQNLGELYEAINDYKRALYYNRMAMDICKKLGDKKF